ncbi:solute carrier family 35 member F6-like isoform X2 [Dysidea avara]|uniref:solute carrier family 35 member F6-like isoform X2 n=1 Tax=Dysidea avara TaxID=196820 RepID=UPI00332C6ADE
MDASSISGVNFQLLYQAKEWHMKRRSFIIFVSVLMVITGTINTLATKWADTIKAKGTNPKPEHYFIHPYMQALGMFAGEASCLVVFKFLYLYYKWVKKDATKYASSYQILHGAVIIFTALLSKAFFGSKLQLYHWVGMLTVVIGLIVVGLGDMTGISYTKDRYSVLAGDLLIVGAQIISAVQVTVEQLFVQGLNVPPLQAIGWEGVFGFCFVGVSLVPMYFIPWHIPSGPHFWYSDRRFEDSIDAVYQIFYIPTLTVSFFTSVVSIAIYNYAELSVTKEINAITSVTLDSVRVLFIWIFEMIVMWQKFSFYQPIGFLILVIGVCVYYDIIFSWVMKRLHIWPYFCGVPDGEDYV